MSTLSPQRQIADRLVTAFTTFDIDTIDRLRTPDCLHLTLPQSLGLPPTPTAQYIRHLRSLVPIFHNFELIVHDVIEDVAARKIVMHLTARADTAAGEYLNEYVWFMEFEGEGEGKTEADGECKIKLWKIYVDVGVNRDFWPKLKAARDKVNGQAAEK